MADVKWIKITTDVFDDEKILLIESLPEADSIIVIWFKLLCLAGKQNNSGVFMMGNQIAYTDKMLATIFRRKEATVQLALQTFQQFGMVELIDGVITIPNWEKHQSIDTLDKIKEQTRKRVARHREKQRALCDSNATSNATVTECNATDKKEIREDKKEIKNIKPTKHKHGEYDHVLLTDVEVEKLINEYGKDIADKAIEYLDEAIEMKGYKYKSHYLAIRKWVIDAVKKNGYKPNTVTTVQDDLDDIF